MRSILIVEDDTAVRSLLGDWLAQCGFAVMEAETAAAALTALDLVGTPDLIVADVQLSDASGQWLADSARDRFGPVRVLLMSGSFWSELISDGAINPAERFLQKPFTRASFEIAVQQALADPDK